MKRHLLSALVATALFVPALAAADPTAAVWLRNPINVKITTTQARLGATASKNETTALTCVHLGHSIVSPRDIQSGLPTGQRQHKPLTCTARGATAGILRLFTALSTNENLPTVVFSGPGSETAVLTLTNANIASIDTRTEPEGYYFEIAFTYQKIKWEKDGVTFTDNWGG
jgi:type VI secretion system secreted protein Hcp